MIGDRIRLVRDYLGITQTELSEKTGVSQSMISYIELGGQPSDDVKARLSHIEGFSEDFLHRGQLPAVNESSLRFRSMAIARRKEVRRLVAQCHFLAELVELIEDQFTLPPVNVPSVAICNSDSEIEAQALFVRRRLMNQIEGPIPNLVRAAERSGVIVSKARENIEGVDAVSFWLTRPVICLIPNSPGDRQRFSMAHELGHLVLHRRRDVPARQAEREANRFAGALLMPSHEALRAIAPAATLTSLARTKAGWGISIAALIRRGYDLKIFDQYRYRSLMKQLSTRGWRKKEPVIVRRERISLLTKALKNRRSGAVNIAKASGLPPIDVNQWAEVTH